MEWKIIVEIGTALGAAALIIKNTLIAARLVVFLFDLRPMIERIARNSDEAVTIAKAAQAAADVASALTRQQGEVLERQNQVLDRILKSMEERSHVDPI